MHSCRDWSRFTPSLRRSVEATGDTVALQMAEAGIAGRPGVQHMPFLCREDAYHCISNNVYIEVLKHAASHFDLAWRHALQDVTSCTSGGSGRSMLTFKNLASLRVAVCFMQPCWLSSGRLARQDGQQAATP